MKHIYSISTFLYALAIEFTNDKKAVAKITAFEKNEGANKIYTIELEELELIKK